MIEFEGFPARMKFTPVPNTVFGFLFPQITDAVELKVLLYIFEILYPKKGSLRYVSLNELKGKAGVLSHFDGSEQAITEGLKKALEALKEKKAILHLSINRGEAREDIYVLNTEANRQLLEKIRSGESNFPEIKPASTNPIITGKPASIFTLYEQNIGILTPLIADELREARNQYPESWIKDAIKEAAAMNKRNWRYIARTLEHWSTEGKDNGTHRGNIKKNTDPDKYIRGKYGHMVQR